MGEMREDEKPECEVAFLTASRAELICEAIVTRASSGCGAGVDTGYLASRSLRSP